MFVREVGKFIGETARKIDIARRSRQHERRVKDLIDAISVVGVVPDWKEEDGLKAEHMSLFQRIHRTTSSTSQAKRTLSGHLA